MGRGKKKITSLNKLINIVSGSLGSFLASETNFRKFHFLICKSLDRTAVKIQCDNIWEYLGLHLTCSWHSLDTLAEWRNKMHSPRTKRKNNTRSPYCKPGLCADTWCPRQVRNAALLQTHGRPTFAPHSVSWWLKERRIFCFKNCMSFFQIKGLLV